MAKTRKSKSSTAKSAAKPKRKATTARRVTKKTADQASSRSSGNAAKSAKKRPATKTASEKKKAPVKRKTTVAAKTKKTAPRRKSAPQKETPARIEENARIELEAETSTDPASTADAEVSSLPRRTTRRRTARRAGAATEARGGRRADGAGEGDAKDDGDRPIPPLPEEEDEELIPFEEGGGDEPRREAPAGATPRDVLEGVRRGELHVSAMNRLSDREVLNLAREVRVKPRPGERRSETLYRLLQEPSHPQATQSTFVEGLLEMHPDGYGFLRRPERSYTQHPEDVYVAAGIIRRLSLRPGHWVSGTARPSRPGERQLALDRVEEVNHEDPEALKGVQPFEDLTVVFPDSRFILETVPEEDEMRVMDLFCPLGRGQRSIITSPPRAGKTVLLQKLADAVAHNSPNVDIVVLLVDERPEEVTNMRRSVRGEVISSTFDRPASNHVRIAELVMEKVKRMVEFGRHVVLLLDSITRLGRAYNNMAGSSGRILTGGLEAKALTKPKRFFGAARNIEDGGSLTIVATALVDTGSRMDDVIFEEFKGTGNMEVVLDRSLANARIWPAINVPKSGTRNEDLLLHPEELRRINLLRRAISAHSPQGAMETITDMMKQYSTNAELLMSIG